MTEKNPRNLTGKERLAIIEWGIAQKNNNPDFNKYDLGKFLEQSGQVRGTRTLERLMKKINKPDPKNTKDWYIDEEIDWWRSDILYSDEVRLESRFLPLIRSTVGWYQYTFGIQSKYQFPRTLTYRWLKWANYFLQSVNPAQSKIEDVDIFVVAQLYTVRSLSISIGVDVKFDDLEDWLTARPWESDQQAKMYMEMIDAGAYSPLLKLVVPKDSDQTMEEIGISFIANTYMNLCDIKEIKGLPKSATWKLPHQQRDILKKWCKENNQEAGIKITIPNVKETLTIGFED